MRKIRRSITSTGTGVRPGGIFVFVSLGRHWWQNDNNSVRPMPVGELTADSLGYHRQSLRMKLPRVYPILDTESLARHGISLETAAASFLEGGAGILQI